MRSGKNKKKDGESEGGEIRLNSPDDSAENGDDVPLLSVDMQLDNAHTDGDSSSQLPSATDHIVEMDQDSTPEANEEKDQEKEELHEEKFVLTKPNGIRRPANYSASDDGEHEGDEEGDSSELLSAPYSKDSRAEPSYLDMLRKNHREILNYPWKKYKRVAVFTEGSVIIEPFYSTFLVVTSVQLAFDFIAKAGGGALAVLGKTATGLILIYAGIGNLKGDVLSVNFCEEADEVARGAPTAIDDELNRINASRLRRWVTKGLEKAIIFGSNVVYINGALIDVIPVTWLFPQEVFGLLRWIPITSAMFGMGAFGTAYYNMFCNAAIRKFVLRTMDVVMHERFVTPSYPNSDPKQVTANTVYGIVNVLSNLGYVLTNIVLTLPTAGETIAEITLTATYRGGTFAFAIKANLNEIFKVEELNVIAGFMKFEFVAAFVNAVFARGYAAVNKYYGNGDELNLIRLSKNTDGEYEGQYKELAAMREKALWWHQYVVYKLRVNGANFRMAWRFGSLTKREEIYAASAAAARSIPLWLLLAAYDVDPRVYAPLAAGVALHIYYAISMNKLFRAAAKKISKLASEHKAEYEEVPNGDSEVGLKQMPANDQPNPGTGAQEQKITRTAQEQKLYDALNLPAIASSLQQFQALEEIFNNTPGLEWQITVDAFRGRVVRFVGYLNFFVTVDAICFFNDEYTKWGLRRPVFIELAYLGLMTSFLTLGNELSQFVNNMREVVPYQMAKLKVATSVFGTAPKPPVRADAGCFSRVKQRATNTWNSLTWGNIKTFFTPKAALPPEKVRVAYQNAVREHHNPPPAEPSILASCKACLFGRAPKKAHAASAAPTLSSLRKRKQG